MEERQAEKKKKYTTTTAKEKLLENFSGFKEKLLRPVVDTKTLLKKNRKTISTTEIFPLWPPFFFGKEKFCTGAGRCMLSFSQPTHRTKRVFALSRLKQTAARNGCYASKTSVRAPGLSTDYHPGRNYYPLTRNYYENNSPRIIFRNSCLISHPQNLRERKTFSRNYV